MLLRLKRLIADNYATHKRPVVQSWLTKAPPYSHALHTHFGILAQYGRAILP
jgi:hypothetical protein